MTAWLGWRAVLAIPVLALPLLPTALPSRRALTRSSSGSSSSSGELKIGSTGRLDVVGAGVLSVLAGYYGVLFRAPSLIERATGGGP
ncbi:hypothetical protein ABZ953_12015 [Streptomyces sp. NPDC046465]|uniref:hypothetical protein n=1 Tax=Streptomyces sp. NPDC046465 TaxID=3155810 RepID=UPI0033D72438